MGRYARGDTHAFGELYDLIGHRVRAFVLRRAPDRATADDLTQQTFLHMHQARASYIDGSDVIPWAFAIARRLVIDRYRRTSRETIADVRDERVSSESPDDALAAKRALDKLEAALEGLPESQRTAFELLKYDGLSVAQAAEVLGTTETAVKLRAHRAYDALRASLAEGEIP